MIVCVCVRVSARTHVRMCTCARGGEVEKGRKRAGEGGKRGKERLREEGREAGRRRGRKRAERGRERQGEGEEGTFFVCLKQDPCYVIQTVLKLLDSGDPPALAPLPSQTTGLYHHTQQ